MQIINFYVFIISWIISVIPCCGIASGIYDCLYTVMLLQLKGFGYPMPNTQCYGCFSFVETGTTDIDTAKRQSARIWLINL